MAASRKLTPKLRSDLCAHLKTGMPILFACARVGLGRKTYYRWRELAADAEALVEEGHPVNADQRALIAFADAVDLARNFGGGWLYEKLLAEKDWTKFSAALERQFHEAWSTRYGANGYTMNVDKKTGAVEVKLSFDIDSDEAKASIQELREH